MPGEHPAVLKDNVTTPGGCTIAGLLTLEDGKFRGTVSRTIEAATKRASELGQVKKWNQSRNVFVYFMKFDVNNKKLQ